MPDDTQQLVEARASQLAAERREDRLLAVLGGFAGGVVAVAVVFAGWGSRR